MDIRSNRHLWFNYFVSFVYSVEETNKATRKKIEKTSMAKKFKDIQSDLAAARERIRQSDDLYKKEGGRVSSYHSGNATKNWGARRYAKTIIANVCFRRFLSILCMQTVEGWMTGMVGARNTQKLTTLYFSQNYNKSTKYRRSLTLSLGYVLSMFLKFW